MNHKSKPLFCSDCGTFMGLLVVYADTSPMNFCSPDCLANYMIDTKIINPEKEAALVANRLVALRWLNSLPFVKVLGGLPG